MPANSAPLAKDPVVDRSLRHSLRDGVYFSAMIGSAESYFSAFAVFLKASTAQIGMLAALPPLLASFSQLSSAWVGRKLGERLPGRGVRRDIIVFGALLQALTLIPLALLPLAYPDLALPILITCAVIYYAGPNLGSPQWGSLMGDLVPETRRGRYFALRTRLSSLANFSALIVAGLALHLLDALQHTYLGFVVLFVSAAALRLASAWHLAHMHDPPGHLAALEAPWHRELWQAFTSTGLLRFSIFFACMQFAVAIASPFFTLYMLRDLQFSYVAFMFNTAASVCVQFLTLNRWGRLSDLFGNRLILVTTGMMIPLLPSLWLVSTSYAYLLAVQALSGLAWAGFTLSATNSVYDLTPRNHRATLMAVHNVLGAAGVFLGAVLGGWLGTVLPREVELFGGQWSWLTPLYGVFVISTVARLAVALVFLPRLREVRKVRRMTGTGLIFRVTRVHPVSGMVFEIVGRFRRNEDDERER
ncbi:MAG: MFS transporter [Pseudomonadales bacterium]